MCGGLLVDVVQQAVLLPARRDDAMQFQLRWKLAGGHVHCRMFQRRAPSETWHKNGDLTFDEQAWSALRVILPLAGFDVVPEDDRLPIDDARAVTGDVVR